MERRKKISALVFLLLLLLTVILLLCIAAIENKKAVTVEDVFGSSMHGLFFAVLVTPLFIGEIEMYRGVRHFVLYGKRGTRIGNTVAIIRIVFATIALSGMVVIAINVLFLEGQPISNSLMLVTAYATLPFLLLVNILSVMARKRIG